MPLPHHHIYIQSKSSPLNKTLLTLSFNHFPYFPSSNWMEGKNFNILFLWSPNHNFPKTYNSPSIKKAQHFYLFLFLTTKNDNCSLTQVLPEVVPIRSFVSLYFFFIIFTLKLPLHIIIKIVYGVKWNSIPDTIGWAKPRSNSHWDSIELLLLSDVFILPRWSFFENWIGFWRLFYRFLWFKRDILTAPTKRKETPLSHKKEKYLQFNLKLFPYWHKPLTRWYLFQRKHPL